ncbi:hypothetical protein CLV51_103545 [Chitinophaga niastensis]|uniref:Methyltransferase family protein n=1 Tax=Chitinophaga niastensis TaxID=536980 RepID=A0A2P8HK19_CHINA|nr:class I SAM-dependent methyltransferase [Chitinophaga niastensis]PSL46564.1 hypothetical protein CLV51_103545 [Chitinophaga niastensis]
MSVIQKVIQSISSQHHHNKNLNLFYGGKDALLAWTPYTRYLLATYPQEILQLDADGQTAGLVHYLTVQAQLAFCAANQYIDVSGAAGVSLKAIYSTLLDDIVTTLSSRFHDFDNLERLHGQRLTQWLLQTNPFAREVNGIAHSHVQEVVCAEYSPAIQLAVLRLDIATMKGPVLDIGCGQNANLVRHLRQNGVEAFGIDRFIDDPEYYLQAGDWLEYELAGNYWGTIISNLSFSNHFLHHHQRSNGQHLGYAKKYMEILGALQPGGSYHYAPQLPMIEEYLSADTYDIRHYQVDDHFQNTVITRR